MSLIELGADVKSTDRYGCTALMLASAKGFAEVARLLLTRGAEVNATDTADGFSAMDWALLRKHREVVGILRQAGGLPKVLDDDEVGPGVLERINSEPS